MTHTDRLAKLHQVAAKEQAAARDLEAQAEAAKNAAAARDALVEAHANGTDTRKAEQALAKARDKAEGAAIRAEAATRRIDRAQAEAQTYEAQHAQELIAELAPQAAAAADALTESARALYEAHTAWHEVSNKVGPLLRHAPGIHDVPTDHELAAMARDLRNFLRQGGAVEPPLPRGYVTRTYKAPKGVEVAA